MWPSAAARVSERLAGQHSTRLEAETLARWLQTWFGPLLPLVAAQCRLVTPLAGAAVLESFAGLLGGLLASLDAAGEGPEDIRSAPPNPAASLYRPCQDPKLTPGVLDGEGKQLECKDE